MAQHYTPIWDDWPKVTQELNDQEKGRLIDALVAYDNGRDWQERIKGNERYVFPGLQARLDRYTEANAGKTKNTERDKTEISKKTESGTKTKNSKSPKVYVYDKDKEYINNNDKAKTCEAETELEDTAVDSLIIRLNKEQIEMTDTHYTELDSFRTELPDDLICYAIDAAVGNGVRKWVYVRRILQEYIQNSIKTVSEAKEHDEKRKQGYISHSTITQKDRKPVSAARYEQREYDEKELEERLGVNEIFSVDWKGAS